MPQHTTTLDLDPDEQRTCKACGWSGPTDRCYELFAELLELRCPECDARLTGTLYLYPTGDEVRRAAAAGNPRAIEELPTVEAREARWARIEREELKRADQLPDVPGDAPFVVDWLLVRDEAEDERYVELRVGEQLLFRELATYECLPRFEAIAKLLRERYGARVTQLRPDEGEAVTYVIGDRLSWAFGPERVNREVLGRPA